MSKQNKEYTKEVLWYALAYSLTMSCFAIGLAWFCCWLAGKF